MRRRPKAILKNALCIWKISSAKGFKKFGPQDFGGGGGRQLPQLPPPLGYAPDYMVGPPWTRTWLFQEEFNYLACKNNRFLGSNIFFINCILHICDSNKPKKTYHSNEKNISYKDAAFVHSLTVSIFMVLIIWPTDFLSNFWFTSVWRWPRGWCN